MPQDIRHSQFVTTYGPGAILEGRTGPRIIPRPDVGLFTPTSGLNPVVYEILDQRMSYGLLGKGARIFHIPSNAELGFAQNRAVYFTRRFPEWLLCLNTQLHGEEGYSVLYQGRFCPVCRSAESRVQEPIRFVRACAEGHLDDVDWSYVVHMSSKGCQSAEWFKWFGGGGSLGEIRIVCPRCNKQMNLGWAYRQPWLCSGRYPEREPLNSRPLHYPCHSDAVIIQRQASNLRIPSLKTLFSIPRRDTSLHNLLQIPAIYNTLVGLGGMASKEVMAMVLGNFLKRGEIAKPVHDEILKYDWGELSKAVNDVLEPVATNYTDLLLEEFQRFQEASIEGVPPVHGQKRAAPATFEVDPNAVQLFSGPAGSTFRITPIQRLRTVTVQTGYRREVDTQHQFGSEVDVSFQIGADQRWYPGVQYFGEGIFITLEGKDGGWVAQLKGPAAKNWSAAAPRQELYPEQVFSRAGRVELHPVFVWWHTLAHLLIRSTSIYAGYSSASIRERVYVELSDRGARGGILLYSTQPGSEGTLGGLIALAPYFDDVLKEAFDMSGICSGDPLCVNHRFAPGMYNGAACYSCLLISETSCEHRNMWLDRNVLGDNMP